MPNKVNDHLPGLKKQMDQSGYCIIKDAIAPDIIAAMHRRIDAQAKAERQLEDEHPKSCVALEQVKIPILAI